jgi:hypothetical protein
MRNCRANALHNPPPLQVGVLFGEDEDEEVAQES